MLDYGPVWGILLDSVPLLVLGTLQRCEHTLGRLRRSTRRHGGTAAESLDGAVSGVVKKERPSGGQFHRLL